RALLGELLELELELRTKRGDHPERREYLDRFSAGTGLVDAAFAGTPGPRGHPAPELRGNGARHPLLGLMALQGSFIDCEALLGAFAAWVADKERPLGRILRDQGALDDIRLALLEVLVSEHLKLYGDDSDRSLAVLSAPGAVVRSFGDYEIQAELGRG